MNRFLLLLAMAMFFVIPTKATHLMGSELRARHLSGYTYEIKLTTYRDTLGIPMDQTATFDIDGIGNSFNTSLVVPQDSLTSGNLMPLYPYGVEVYYFIDTLTFPDTGQYEITWSDCCRNHAIQNMSNPGSERMFLRNIVTVTDSATPNSSPLFLVPPVVFLPIQTPWQYNPLPFDPDGDSLVWSIVTPLSTNGSLVNGYTLPAFDTSNPYSIDPVTGTISWTASTIGNWDAAVLIEEYRNGVKIGEMRRDMQYITVSSLNSIASFTNTETLPTNDRGYYEATIPVGTPFTVQLSALDPDPQDQLFLEAYGAPLTMTKNPAQFYYNANGGPNQVLGTFNWTPDISALRKDPYITVFRATDGMFSFDLSMLLRVVNTTSVEDLHQHNMLGTIYPNPASDQIHIPITLESATTAGWQIMDVSGKLVMQSAAEQMSAGTHMIVQPIDLPTGVYLLRAYTEEGGQHVQRFVVK